ncbi:MAG TPA: YfbM family protein [Verrucomicrobiae bacterium]|nr:YfbM family protein [Verrucomicrobiae bacterium]
MSIEASYRRVTPHEFAKLQSDPKAASSFFGTNLDDLELDNPEALLAKMQEQESSDRYLDIGKDWHALHFLLTGDGELGEHVTPPPPPLGNVVQGGTETEWDCTYGHVRSLTPDEVRAVAEALGKISVGDLRSRFSVESFNAADIYPHGYRASWTEDEAESVFEIYPSVVEFFQLAAKDGDIILLSSD